LLVYIKLIKIMGVQEESMYCNGCRHRISRTDVLRFLERKISSKDTTKMELVITQATLKVSQMLQLVGKSAVECVKCGATVGKVFQKTLGLERWYFLT